MQQFSLVYNNLFVFLEPVDEPRPTYDCGQLMQSTVTVQKLIIKPKVTEVNNLSASCLVSDLKVIPRIDTWE